MTRSDPDEEPEQLAVPAASASPAPAPIEATPDWFRRALADVPEHRELRVDGATVRYRAWGRPELPGVLLVHGGAAHAGWWDHIAPQLSGHRVVALDLSGHGDSDHRDTYDMLQWGREVMAVAADDGMAQPVVVGHSLGGWVAAFAGAGNSDAVTGVVLLDSPLSSRPPDTERLRKRRAPHRTLPSAEAVLERFTTTPRQALVLPYVKTHVARQSAREVEGGWTWKFDPGFYGRRLPDRTFLTSLGCPAALFRSENGLVSTQMAADMAEAFDGPFPVVDIPDAGHHPMLDQPLALLAGLRTLLAVWPPAGRRRARETGVSIR